MNLPALVSQTSPSDPPINIPHISVHSVLWGLAVFAVGMVISFLVRLVVRALLSWRGRSPSAAHVFGHVGQVVVLLLALGTALAIIFPSVKPVDVLGGLGVVSIAAGIAFQTVLGNVFAGMAILARDRFRVGDQIAIGEYAGQVEAMRLSSTVIRTFDGRLVLIPNAKLHTDVVTVQTGYEAVRTSVMLDLDDRSDLLAACEVARAAMDSLAAVLPNPPAQALLKDTGSGTVGMELRFWSGARQLETREARHQVIAAVLQAFDEHNIATGVDVQYVDPRPALPTAKSQTDRPADQHSDQQGAPEAH